MNFFSFIHECHKIVRLFLKNIPAGSLDLGVIFKEFTYCFDVYDSPSITLYSNLCILLIAFKSEYCYDSYCIDCYCLCGFIHKRIIYLILFLFYYHLNIFHLNIVPFFNFGRSAYKIIVCLLFLGFR